MVWPDLVKLAGEAVLLSVRTADWVAVSVTEAVVDFTAVAEFGGVPCAVALLVMLPLSTSAWVVASVAVQFSLAPGASVVCGQVIADRPDGALTELIPTPDSVTLPVLVTA